MTRRKSGDWTRRQLLGTVPALMLPGLLTRGSGAELGAAPAVASFSKFIDVAKAAGLTETMPYGGTTDVKYIIESMGGGCAFFDYDNDGWMDIFIVCGRKLEGIPPGASNRLYHNNRDGTFKDVTAKAGLIDAGWGTGVCVGDYNNDGFEDLFVTYYGQNKLYHNNGDGTFTDMTAKAGLLHLNTRFSTGCTFLDYNRDGLLDCLSPTMLSSTSRLRRSLRYRRRIVISRALPSIAARVDCLRLSTICTATTAMVLSPMCRRSQALWRYVALTD